MTGRLQPKLRRRLNALFVLLWIAAGIIGAEAAARAYRAWALAANPLLNGTQSPWEGPPPPAFSPSSQVLPRGLSWAETAPAPPFAEDHEILDPQESKEKRQARRAASLSLDPEDLRRSAIAQGETVIELESGLKVREVYGSAYFERTLDRASFGDAGSAKLGPLLATSLNKPLPELSLAERFAALAENGVPAEWKVSVPVGDGEYELVLDAVAGTAGERCRYLFARLDELQLRLYQADREEVNPRWDLLDLRYRKNFIGDPQFTTNSLGYRSREPQIPKPPGLFRIVCIGGSTTAEGFTNETTYPALLEARLREMYPANDIEVLNCGVQGLRTRGQFLHMPNFLKLEPDLVIGYLGVNDIKLDLPIPLAATPGS